MTEKEALHFEYFSSKNAAILSCTCPKCEPYEDWFTYKRWKAQGKQVARGQRGTHIFVVIEKETKDENGETLIDNFVRQIPVFCRHQLS